MSFEKPKKDIYTVYSISACKYCVKVLDELKKRDIKYEVIKCDEYYLDDYDSFFLFMKEMHPFEELKFPMVFFNDTYIGGYTNTVQYLEEQQHSVKDLQFEAFF